MSSLFAYIAIAKNLGIISPNSGGSEYHIHMIGTLGIAPKTGIVTAGKVDSTAAAFVFQHTAAELAHRVQAQTDFADYIDIGIPKAFQQIGKDLGLLATADMDDPAVLYGELDGFTNKTQQRVGDAAIDIDHAVGCAFHSASGAFNIRG